MIEGLKQGIEYGSSSWLIYFHTRLDGADVTSVTGTPTVTIYDQDNVEILAAANLTQIGSTCEWKYALDASATSTWELGYDYHCVISFVVSGVTYTDDVYMDVVRKPFNQPLITTESVDKNFPLWSGHRPSGWTDWVTAIEIAHVQLVDDLRNMKDSQGDWIYPHQILDRGQLRKVEMAYVARIIVENLRFDEDTKRDYRNLATAAMGDFTRMLLDKDDDLKVDEEETDVMKAGSTFIR